MIFFRSYIHYTYYNIHERAHQRFSFFYVCMYVKTIFPKIYFVFFFITKYFIVFLCGKPQKFPLSGYVSLMKGYVNSKMKPYLIFEINY